MAMSALVKEQIEGIAPLAISMMAPKKFAVSQDLIKPTISWVLNIKHGGQKWTNKDSDPANWMALENVKEEILFLTFKCVLITFTAIPANDKLSHSNLYYTTVYHVRD